MTTTNGTTAYVVEVPRHGSVPLAPDKERLGRMKWVLEEAEWTPVHFTHDGDWQPASAMPPCPPTPFDTREAAEEHLRRTLHREEVLAAARSGPVSPYLKAGRVSEASALQVREDFRAEVEIERRAAKLDLLRAEEQRATSRRETEESELAAIRAEAKAELERLKDEAKHDSTDWAALGGHAKVQSRRRADGTEVYRARVAGEVSPSFDTAEEAVAWRDEREQPEQPPPLIGRAEGSRPAEMSPERAARLVADGTGGAEALDTVKRHFGSRAQ